MAGPKRTDPTHVAFHIEFHAPTLEKPGDSWLIELHSIMGFLAVNDSGYQILDTMVTRKTPTREDLMCWLLPKFGNFYTILYSIVDKAMATLGTEPASGEVTVMSDEYRLRYTPPDEEAGNRYLTFSCQEREDTHFYGRIVDLYPIHCPQNPPTRTWLESRMQKSWGRLTHDQIKNLLDELVRVHPDAFAPEPETIQVSNLSNSSHGHA